MRINGVVLMLALASSGASAQTPYSPASDDTVVLRLADGAIGAADWAEPRRLRDALDQRPDDPRIREALARWYLEQGQRSGDARLYGHAAAVLEPWQDTPRPAPEIAVLRAALKQHEHRFEEALADLEIAIAGRRRNPRAWLARATILENLGRPHEALRACAPLRRLTARAVALACSGSALGLTGDDRRAAAMLQRALATTDHGQPQLRAWILTRLADSQRRLGRPDRAIRSLREALQLAPGDAFTLTRLADLLLARGDHLDVLALRAPDPQPMALALRRAIAARALGRPGHRDRVEALVTTRDADRRRDGLRHLSDEARLALDLENEPDDALHLATLNWQVQRTPADAHLLVRAALAAGRPAAARPVFEWLTRTGHRDPQLDALTARLKASEHAT